jgi:hypothetical protein
MARPKKPTKTLRRARARIAEPVGPERRRVKSADEPRVEEFILEEARNVRERKHGRLSKEEIVAIGRAKARGRAVPPPPGTRRGKAKTREHSANAYRKSGARRAA